jgi:hypothetical protein
MTINRIAGQTLQSVLERDGIDISIANANVGINTASPSSEFEVAGILTVGNVTISNIGNINCGNTWINDLNDPLQDQDGATKFYVDSQLGNIANIGNLTIANTTISSGLANADILIDAPGTGQFKILGTDGFVVPAGDTGERPDPTDQGTLRFNTLTNQLEVWTGSEWDGVGGQSVITNQTIDPDGVTDTYTLDQSSTAEGILVTLNGVQQTPGSAYIVSGDQITFSEIPLITDIIQVRFIAAVSTIAGLTNSTANSSVTVTNTPSIVFEIDNADVAIIDNNKIFNIANCHSLQLSVYDVANATALTNVADGQIIYVSNGNSGNPCLAVYSINGWKQVALGANITI